MKKSLLYVLCFFMIASQQSFSQEKTDPASTTIKPALLVIDIQNAYLAMVPEREKEVSLYYINTLIDLFHEKGFPVIRIYHFSEKYGPKQGTEDFEFPASVKIKPEDPSVIKTYSDGFNKTELDQILQQTGNNTVFITGLSAVGCALATWIGAQNHDYKAFLVKDALMSHNSDYTNNVEEMFDAVSFDIVKLILENAQK